MAQKLERLTVLIDHQAKKEFEELSKIEDKKKMNFGGYLLKKGMEFFKLNEEGNDGKD